MTREEFRDFVLVMKAFYPDKDFIPDMYAFDGWYAVMGDLPLETAKSAFAAYMHTEESHFKPLPADIRKHIFTDDGPTAEEEWAKVAKAIRNGYYNAEAEFAKLSPLAQKAVGSPETIREWAVMPSDEVRGVQRAIFIKTYNALVKREKEQTMIPPQIRETLKKHDEPKAVDTKIAEEGKGDGEDDEREQESRKESRLLRILRPRQDGHMG